VVTHSSGNHGAAVALAAQIRGIQAHVVVPANTPQIKRAAIRSYGVEPIVCEATIDAREQVGQPPLPGSRCGPQADLRAHPIQPVSTAASSLSATCTVQQSSA
jgi:hypothetical protein